MSFNDRINEACEATRLQIGTYLRASCQCSCHQPTCILLIPYTIVLLDLMHTSFKELWTLLLEPLLKNLHWLPVKQRIVFTSIKTLQTGQPNQSPKIPSSFNTICRPIAKYTPNYNWQTGKTFIWLQIIWQTSTQHVKGHHFICKKKQWYAKYT